MTMCVPKRNDQGFTLIELMIVVAIISILAGFSVPGLLRAKMTGNEAAAIGSLSAVRTAQVSYSLACGSGGFAVKLTTLGTATPGTTQAFLSKDVSTVDAPLKSGYTYGIAAGAGATNGPNDCNGTATKSAFYGSAVPKTFGTTGRKSFAINAANTMWMLESNVAPTEPFSAPAKPIQ